MTQEQEDQNGRLTGAWFGWAWVLPQAVLLWLNLRAWILVRGDLSDVQKILAAYVGLFEAALLLCGVACLVWWIVRRRSIGPWLALGALGLHVGYLWYVMARMSKIMPASVTLWMLPESELIFYQFSLIMPVIFLMLVRLSRVGTGLSRAADIGISIGLLVGIPTGAYILGMALSRLMREFNFKWEGLQYFIIAGLIAATALVLVAFLKLLIRLHGLISRQRWSEWVLPLAAGLAAPLGGLALNAGIPFPYDFQSVTVYALTVLNGAALLIPFRSGFRGSTAGWAARAIFFPFSLYFFLVFLPFFPLSLLAMIAAGAGVLILAPVLLLVVHGRLLLDQGRVLSGTYGGRRVAALFAACVLVLPAVFIIRCESDRRTLARAADAVFSPDYRSKTVDVHPKRLARALGHMEDVKKGIYLPYLTDAYNALVFHGLVLPDEKADQIRQSLLAETPLRSVRSLWGRGSVFSESPRAARRTRGAGVTHGVEMAAPEVESRATNDVMEVEVRLSLENRSGGNGEFSAPIAVPEGVLVTGFWLDVNGTNKPARLRERKTAVWVYEMIRDMTRRDPGLLVYESDTRLRLRVYPFAVGQRRKCGVTFRFPSALQPVIRIQDTPVALHKGAEADTRAVTVSVGEGNALVAPSASKSGWPQFVRQPAAHLILDRSAASAATEAETVQRAKAAISALPVSVQKVRVTWANYEQEDVSGSPETREVALGALDRTVSLPFRGGFCPERVIARLLLEERGKAEQQPAGPVPLFIVVPAPGSSPVKVGGLAAFTRFVPDMPAYIVCSSGGWEQASFGGGSAQPVSLPDLAPAPIMAVRKGKAVELLSAAAEGGLVLVPGEAGRGEWECWDPAQKTFRPIERLARCADPDYAAGLALWARHRALGWEPGSIDTALPGLVADAQAAGIAIPETAFVVVETSAQEVMLARKEKQSLGAGHALEFDEVKRAPAPPALWLLPVAFYLLYRRFRNTMSDCKSGNRQVSRA